MTTTSYLILSGPERCPHHCRSSHPPPSSSVCACELGGGQRRGGEGRGGEGREYGRARTLSVLNRTHCQRCSQCSLIVGDNPDHPVSGTKSKIHPTAPPSTPPTYPGYSPSARHKRPIADTPPEHTGQWPPSYGL